MTPRLYPMGPILSWAQWCFIEFDMTLVRHVEKRGRELAFFFRLETT